MYYKYILKLKTLFFLHYFAINKQMDRAVKNQKYILRRIKTIYLDKN